MRRSTLLRNAAFMRQRRIVSCAPLPRMDTNEHELKRVVARIARIDANGTLFAAIREIRVALLCTYSPRNVPPLPSPLLPPMEEREFLRLRLRRAWFTRGSNSIFRRLG